jgi:cyanophycinase
MRATHPTVILILILSLAPCLAQGGSYRYIRIGNEADVQPRVSFGLALMGGGSDLDEAFQWLCAKDGGGDFLVLRAAGDDDYNPYINKLCKTNSVATLIIPDRETAADPKVADIIRHAEVPFIAGGDQARYINFWMGTPVQEACCFRIGPPSRYRPASECAHSARGGLSR